MEFTFQAGSEDDTNIIVGRTLPIDDSKSEPNEGFLLYVKINESSLHQYDVDRITFQKTVLVIINGKLPKRQVPCYARTYLYLNA